MISGSYAGQSSNLQLLLRLDVDGARPLNMLSGDLFRAGGGPNSYIDSFVIRAIQRNESVQGLELRGVGTSAYSGAAYSIYVAVGGVGPAGAPSQVMAMISATGFGQFTFLCSYLSPAFRRVVVNYAYEANSFNLTAY
jgi:hypothetical protein